MKPIRAWLPAVAFAVTVFARPCVAITLDFESYPQSFPANSIQLGSLSFEGNSCWNVDNFQSQFFTLISNHTLGGCLVDTPLTMFFAVPTSTLSFDYAFGTAPNPQLSLDVTGFLGGQQVFHQVFIPTANACAAFPTCDAEGVVSIPVAVDRVVVVPTGEQNGPSFVNAAIDNISGIPTAPSVPMLTPGLLATLVAAMAVAGILLLRR